MPPRDEQDYEIRRQQIIDGALHVFASKGFERATNKEIAQASGIGSPGLIYHYFKDKADLLRQVMEQRAPVLHLLSQSDSMMTLPPHEALLLFGRAFLKLLENRSAVAMMRLVLSESIRQPMVAQLFNAIGPMRGLTFLQHYLVSQMDAGVLRRMDAGAAARCFIGPLVVYVLLREVFPQADSQSLDSETMVRDTIDIFLHGMLISSADALG